MKADHGHATVARRSFLVRVSTAAAALGFGSTAAHAREQTASPSAAVPTAPLAPSALWQPARHPQDDWFDQLPGKHRFFFDATTVNGVQESTMFASNYYGANKSGYGLNDADLAVIVGVRHHATPFAFTDAMWAKYGEAWGERLDFNDPKTKKRPIVNVYLADLDGLVKHGVQFAVCDMATHAYASMAARRISGDFEEIYKELRANCLANCHFVPAGIVGVNRAQERGYSIAYVG
jgi:intracellular sulfur oxidation DsrE/DsrF family protein